MSAVTSDYLARDWARRLEDREVARTGLTRRAARKRLADRIGVMPGTLENLSRDRIKGVRHWIFSALREAVESELKREIAAHTHELETLARIGRDPAGAEMQAVVAGRDALKARLTKGDAA